VIETKTLKFYLDDANKNLKVAAVEVPIETLEESISKLDSINESLAFTIENLQETTHVMSLASRQLKDLESMANDLDGHFYQKKTHDQVQDLHEETSTSIPQAIENIES
jgi:multidrug resistance efflux pump